MKMSKTSGVTLRFVSVSCGVKMLTINCVCELWGENVQHFWDYYKNCESVSCGFKIPRLLGLL